MHQRMGTINMKDPVTRAMFKDPLGLKVLTAIKNDEQECITDEEWQRYEKLQDQCDASYERYCDELEDKRRGI